MRKKNKKKFQWWSLLIFLGFLFVLIGYGSYIALYKPNGHKDIKSSKLLYLSSEISADSLISYLITNKYIESKYRLKVAAIIKKFNQNIKPGKFTITADMNNAGILNMFIARNQTPTKITFNNVRTKEELANKLGAQLLIDSLDIISVLNNAMWLKTNNLSPQTVCTIFIPDTYEVYWTISAQDLINRMIRESDAFWTEERRQKAKAIKLSREQVSTLASIVEEETKLNAEKPLVAGLYINRLNKGYLLQADPTLKFALNDFAKKRILNVDKEVDSPYNTYKYKGLPPGPIRIPEKSSIDAVLNYKKHNYLYMCAKADLSGSHQFSKSYLEHLRYAKAYHRALNKRKIYK